MTLMTQLGNTVSRRVRTPLRKLLSVSKFESGSGLLPKRDVRYHVRFSIADIHERLA